MTWFSASLIMYFQTESVQDEEIVVWENVVLLQAESFDEAVSMANERGQIDQREWSDGLTLKNEKASLLFAGVRKITECEYDKQNDKPGILVSGMELSYSEFIVKSKQDVDDLVASKEVNVLYVD